MQEPAYTRAGEMTHGYAGESPASARARRRAATHCKQRLTLILEGITAEDYLAWVHDPEPLALGHELTCITARAEPLADRVEVELVWDREPPAPRTAVVAAGFLLTPEVVDVRDSQVGDC